MTTGNVITQVNAPEGPAVLNDVLPEVIHLVMRGKKFRIERDSLLELPESLLLSLSGSPTYSDEASGTVSMESGHEVIHIDFNPDCFLFILSHFSAVLAFLNPPTLPLDHFRDGAVLYDNLEQEDQVAHNERLSIFGTTTIPDILQQRPAVVVLREDIEYYCLNGDPNVSHETIAALRRGCGDILEAQKAVFDGLHDGDVLDTPEFYLKQMLCLAGFSPDETWGYRARETNRSQVLSVHLLNLKVPEEGDEDRIQAVQKLLLFWKKPARKCWWNKFSMSIDGHNVTVHLRRVWTFELSILGIASE